LLARCYKNKIEHKQIRSGLGNAVA